MRKSESRISLSWIVLVKILGCFRATPCYHVQKVFDMYLYVHISIYVYFKKIYIYIIYIYIFVYVGLKKTAPAADC